MLALDTAFKEFIGALGLKTALHNAPPHVVAVKFASPRRDTPVPFISHFASNSKPSAVAGGFGAQEGRDYEHTILVVHRQGVAAEALSDQLQAAIVYGGARRTGIVLAVAGWEDSDPVTWLGDVHDLGDLLVDGTICPYAGFRVNVSLQRPLAR